MSPRLRYFSYLVPCSVLLLILKGALVTSNNAGLAVPDWPTSYGENMFLFPPSKWVGTIFYEHVHRLIASIVGAMTLILTIWILRVEKRKWVKVLSVIALFAVILQGLLGGLTVLYQLPAAVSSAHGVLAQTFFIITIIIAYSQSPEFLRKSGDNDQLLSTKPFKASLLFIGLIFVQLIVGAFMRHTESGLAVPDFPTMGGKYLPEIKVEYLDGINAERKSLQLPQVTFLQVGLHLFHRLFAFVVFLGFLAFSFSIFKNVPKLKDWNIRARRLTALIGLIILLQISMGILVLWTLRDPWVASIHVMLGALLLGLSTLVALRVYSKAS